MYNLKPYSDDEYEFIYETKKLLYKKYVEEFYGEWNEESQKKMYKEFIKERKDNINIVMVDGEKAGFVDGKIISDKEYEQGNICLNSNFQGKGIGSLYLQDVINQNINKDIILRVFKSNPAQRLYLRFGFEFTGETNSHFIMKKSAKSRINLEKI